jgi:hypothetical protein
LRAAKRYQAMEHAGIGQNYEALLELAAKLRRFAEETECEGYGGLFLLAASALDERAFFVAAGDADIMNNPAMPCPDRSRFN